MNAIFRYTAAQRVKHVILPTFKTKALTTSITPKALLNTAAHHKTVLKGAANPLSSRLSFHTSTKHYAAIETQDGKAIPAASEILLNVDGQEENFSALLLRDMCHCPSCVHPTTRQKLYSTADIPTSIKPRSVHVSESSITLTWKNDVPGFDYEHSTVFQTDDLKTLSKTGALPGPFAQALPSQVLWDSASADIEDTSFDDYMANDAALLRVLKQLRTHGLVFVTDIPDDEHAMSQIATRMGPMKDTFYGRTWDVRTVPSAINAAYTSSDLGFHTDLLYFQDPPHNQLLHCIQSSSAGGASVFSDAFKSASDLLSIDADAFDCLASLPVNYQYCHPGDNLYHTTKRVFETRELRIGDTTFSNITAYMLAWKDQELSGQPLHHLTLEECLEKINWGPPFMAPFSLAEHSQRPGFGVSSPHKVLNRKIEKWHHAAQKFSQLLQSKENLYERLMKPGECVLFDNTRVLHARRGFEEEDAGKPRWLKGGYVDKDPYFSKLRVLQSQCD